MIAGSLNFLKADSKVSVESGSVAFLFAVLHPIREIKNSKNMLVQMPFEKLILVGFSLNKQ